MKLKISFQNLGGELDSRVADDDVSAVEVLTDMVSDLGNLNAGDKFIITEVED